MREPRPERDSNALIEPRPERAISTPRERTIPSESYIHSPRANHKAREIHHLRENQVHGRAIPLTRANQYPGESYPRGLREPKLTRDHPYGESEPLSRRATQERAITTRDERAIHVLGANHSKRELSTRFERTKTGERSRRPERTTVLERSIGLERTT